MNCYTIQNIPAKAVVNCYTIQNLIFDAVLFLFCGLMKKVLMGLSIVICAFGVVIGVMIKTNPELRSAYYKYRDLYLQNAQVQFPVVSGNWSAMTGWDQGLKMVDLEQLTSDKAEALVYGMFPACESPSMITDQTPIVI